MTAITKDQMAELEKLAKDARPTNDEDWGSERQIAAENRFFKEIDRGDGDGTILGQKFDDWCLKATSEEMLTEALRRLRQRVREWRQ